MAPIDQQLRRPQTDYIDVHCGPSADPHTLMEETMYRSTSSCAQQVRAIGGSTMPAYKFAQMVMIADWKGYARPIAMQNLQHDQRERARDELAVPEQGVGLIPIHHWRAVSSPPTAARKAAARLSAGRTTRRSSPAPIMTATGRSPNG
jgi:aryl-alcohol dehydrogenase-like predicted oxidoreductase